VDRGSSNTAYIESGSPWETAIAKVSTQTARRAVLNDEIFYSMKETHCGAVNSEGLQEILDIREGAKENKSGSSSQDSCRSWSIAAVKACSRSFRKSVEVLSRASRIACQTRTSNAASCFSITTSQANLKPRRRMMNVRTKMQAIYAESIHVK
jgi:hypothetical protein